eukprot:TRINITY_DN619_c0_g1_i2.p2 TRINITY_DN619_c0_g1~~TRINITY_DN619_c0_g1_i2.p2  ORF type:complete len:250 (-),score=55.68 TRINITY_DN619_c0_g1_i2:40-789(-)
MTNNGEGNFNLTINFNCDSYIPYFPASYHRSEHCSNCFVLGLESPDLLVEALVSQSSADKNACFAAMKNALQYHVDQIMEVVNSFDHGEYEFLGVDTSAAPSKDCSSMVDVFKGLGLPYFGASGTIEAASLLTKVFKSIENVNIIGFSGLMLAVTEDLGLAEGTKNHEFDIRSLLTYSSVCGIGLDTVPIPGDTPKDKIIALMKDTGTMAFRLNKPLTVRLFPVPGLSEGVVTSFESNDLCNCAVLKVH